MGPKLPLQTTWALSVSNPVSSTVEEEKREVQAYAEARADNIFTVLYTPVAVSCIIPSQRIGTSGGGTSDE